MTKFRVIYLKNGREIDAVVREFVDREAAELWGWRHTAFPGCGGYRVELAE